MPTKAATSSDFLNIQSKVGQTVKLSLVVEVVVIGQLSHVKTAVRVFGA